MAPNPGTGSRGVMDAGLANRLGALVRAADPDRYFSALFAPAPARAYLFALYAFNHEVARVAETAREPMMGAIRLEWWRETVEGARAGAPRNHDVAKGLAALFQGFALPLADFEAIIAARAFDGSAERFADLAALENYVDATGGGVMRLGVTILGGDAGLAREAALAYGLAGLLRSLAFHNARHKLYLPLDLLNAVGLTQRWFSNCAMIPAWMRWRINWRCAPAIIFWWRARAPGRARRCRRCCLPPLCRFISEGWGARCRYTAARWRCWVRR